MMTETIALLQTCDAGVKTAVNSLENALRKAKNPEMARELQRSLEAHRVLGSTLHRELDQRRAEGKEPSAMARVMAKGMMDLRWALSPRDGTVACLVSDGCAMGIRTVCREGNRRPGADEAAHALARRITETEHETVRRLEPYL